MKKPILSTNLHSSSEYLVINSFPKLDIHSECSRNSIKIFLNETLLLLTNEPKKNILTLNE